jgi:hypothetical protein
VGLYFRKRIGLGPLALNFSKTGIGISAGVRGLRAGVSSHRRVYTSAGLPGTGVRRASNCSVALARSFFICLCSGELSQDFVLCTASGVVLVQCRES